MAEAWSVRGCVRVAALGRRRVELHQLDFSVTVRGPQHRELRLGSFQPDDAVNPAAFDLGRASRLQSQYDEELDCGREVVDHDTDVFHPLDRHLLVPPV